MRFWVKAFAMGIAGVILTFISWLIANPEIMGVVSSGQIMITLAVAGSAFMLLGALHTLGEILERHR